MMEGRNKGLKELGIENREDLARRKMEARGCLGDGPKWPVKRLENKEDGEFFNVLLRLKIDGIRILACIG